jgi:hypothetical protein
MEAIEFLIYAVGSSLLIVVSCSMYLCFMSRNMVHKLGLYSTVGDYIVQFSEEGRSWFAMLSSNFNKNNARVTGKDINARCKRINKQLAKLSSVNFNRTEVERVLYLVKIFKGCSEVYTYVEEMGDDVVKGEELMKNLSEIVSFLKNTSLSNSKRVDSSDPSAPSVVRSPSVTAGIKNEASVVGTY